MGIFIFLSLFLFLLYILEEQRGYHTLKKDRIDGLGRQFCLIEIKKTTELNFVHINKFCVKYHKKISHKNSFSENTAIPTVCPGNGVNGERCEDPLHFATSLHKGETSLACHRRYICIDFCLIVTSHFVKMSLEIEDIKTGAALYFSKG